MGADELPIVGPDEAEVDMSKKSDKTTRVKEMLDMATPGESWLVKFADDPVWQEHVLIFPVKKTAWVGLS